MTLMSIRSSLRRKITLGYYAIASLIVGLSLFTLVDLNLIEQKILAGARISELFDISLEIRRFEKNFFLYRQTADFEENAEYIAKAKRLLQENEEDFRTLAGSARFTELDTELTSYSELMARYAQIYLSDPAQAHKLEQDIRNMGKEILTTAEDIAHLEWSIFRHWLDGHRTKLLLFVAGLTVLVVALGQLLSRLVARPLKHMEESMEAVANGRLNHIDIPSKDGEIISLTNAFNHMLRELELRQNHLVRSEKLASLGTLLSGVAHELNNPLSNISTSCQILLEELYEPDIDFKKELLTQIDDQTNRARNTVRSLLNFTREREALKQPVDLNKLVAETIGFTKGQIPARVTITTTIPDGIVFPADKQKLQQTFLNLIINAIEATEGAGEITITAVKRNAAEAAAVAEFKGRYPASHGCKRDVEAVDIRVHDNGHGIPAAVLPHIFDPFFTTKEVGKGSGLGLFIVYEIIEEHGGCITVESVENRGTTFFIRLPLGNDESDHQNPVALEGNTQ